MDGFWIALGESVLRFHGQIEPMCFIMPDTIACCLSHVTGNFRPTLGFRFMMSSRRAHVSPGRFAIPSPLLSPGFCFFSSQHWRWDPWQWSSRVIHGVTMRQHRV